MEFNLTTEQKIQSLQNAEITMSHEIYNILIRCGIDPETFDESEVDSIIVSGLEGEIVRLKRLILSLNVVRTKLETI